MNLVNIKGQGHSLTFVQGHSDSTFSNFIFLETAEPIEAKFQVKPPWDGGTKVYSNGPGHMTNMAAMPIYGKNLKNLFLWNKKVSDDEYWYAALGTRVLPSLFNGDTGMTLTYFTARSNLVPYAFVWEKGKTNDFFQKLL